MLNNVTQENLSLGSLTKLDSKQSSQLQTLARQLKFRPLDMILSNK